MSWIRDSPRPARSRGAGESATCKRRFTTYERVEYTLPTVVKKDGQRVPFDRDKILRSLKIACNKRPVSADELEAPGGVR